MIILAIETSCDDTSASVICDTVVKSNIISSQLIHSEFGGVVPELASRAHIQMINKIVKSALLQANIRIEEVNAIAVTTKPGLIGSLIVGTNFAKGLALKYNLPVIPINHLEGHIYSGCIVEPEITFPFISLVVSGGHSALFKVDSYLEYKMIGNTRDDAAGEAFDKIATLLTLPYPGGPAIDKLASKGNPDKYNFPRAMMKDNSFDFSFSGLKTSVRYFLQKNYPDGIDDNLLPDLAASVQSAIIDVLLYKTISAAIEYNVEFIVISGGVSVNSELRRRMKLVSETINKIVVMPDLSYCTDNAAMIGFVAEKKLLEYAGNYPDDLTFTASASVLKKFRR